MKHRHYKSYNFLLINQQPHQSDDPTPRKSINRGGVVGDGGGGGGGDGLKVNTA